MTFVLTRAALADLKEIRDFLARDSLTAAAAELARLDRTMRWLADGDIQGPDVLMTNGRLLRRWSVPPYRIYYRRMRNRTVIVRVYHQARRSIEA